MLQRLLLCFVVCLTLTPYTGAQPSMVGDWAGELQGTGLVAVFHIAEEGGVLTSTLDVPAQGAMGVPTGETGLRGDTLAITIPVAGGAYEGLIRGDTIAGTWTQRGESIPLMLVRMAPGTEVAPPERDDMPKSPFPYRDQEVNVTSVEGVMLAGTLTLPEGEGPFPGVVLVSGSGAQNRDEQLLGHRPFLVLADFLARRGIAVLRYDDRGVEGSTGDHAAATTADFALDAQAVAEYLAARPEVAEVGIIGHSEGGSIAPMAANASDAIDFVVLLAGPAVPIRDVLVYQFSRDLPSAGVSDEGAAVFSAATEKMLDEAASGDADSAAERAVAVFEENLAGLSEADRAAVTAAFDAKGTAESLVKPWMRYFIAYDPTPDLQALRVPALAVFGALDQQVRAGDNVPAMENALANAPEGSSVLVLEGYNHLFQPTETGDPMEYAQINTSFAPEMMEAVADWVEQQMH